MPKASSMFEWEPPAKLRCCKCREIKPASDFYSDKSRKCGLHPDCKECHKAQTKAYAASHREYCQRKARERYERRRHQNGDRYRRYRESFKNGRKRWAKTLSGRLRCLLDRVHYRSKKQGRPFDLDIEWLKELYVRQNGRCLLTGIKLELVPQTRTGRYAPFSPSLDKINPKGDYTKDNVRLVCTAVNVALNDFGEDVFLRVCLGFLGNRAARDEGRSPISYDSDSLTDGPLVDND